MWAGAHEGGVFAGHLMLRYLRGGRAVLASMRSRIASICCWAKSMRSIVVRKAERWRSTSSSGFGGYRRVSQGQGSVIGIVCAACGLIGRRNGGRRTRGGVWGDMASCADHLVQFTGLALLATSSPSSSSCLTGSRMAA